MQGIFEIINTTFRKIFGSLAPNTTIWVKRIKLVQKFLSNCSDQMYGMERCYNLILMMEAYFSALNIA